MAARHLFQRGARERALRSSPSRGTPCSSITFLKMGTVGLMLLLLLLVWLRGGAVLLLLSLFGVIYGGGSVNYMAWCYCT